MQSLTRQITIVYSKDTAPVVDLKDLYCLSCKAFLLKYSDIDKGAIVVACHKCGQVIVFKFSK